MFKNILDSVEGADTFSIIVMLIFLISFIFIIYRAFFMDKKVENRMKNLPLDDDSEELKTN